MKFFKEKFRLIDMLEGKEAWKKDKKPESEGKTAEENPEPELVDLMSEDLEKIYNEHVKLLQEQEAALKNKDMAAFDKARTAYQELDLVMPPEVSEDKRETWKKTVEAIHEAEAGVEAKCEELLLPAVRGEQLVKRENETALAVAADVSGELATDNRFSDVQKTELKKPEVTELVAAEIKNKPTNGYKLKSFLVNFSFGVGGGWLARTIARRAVDFALPGSSIIGGAAGGAAAETFRVYRAERKRKKEVTEYTKQKDEGIQLAAKYVELLDKVKNGKGLNTLSDSFRLADLAAEIKANELKNVKGAEQLKKLVSIREGAATEAIGQNKEAKQLLEALQVHYSTKTNKKRLAKAALRGGLIGAAGGAVGGMIADYLQGSDPHIVSVMEAGKEKVTMLKGAAAAATPDSLPMRGTVWGTAKEFLKSQGIDVNNANVLKAVKSLTPANDVDVMAWGEQGRHIKDIAMQESHQLKGFHDVLKLFGKDVAAMPAAESFEMTPGRVVAKLIDKVPPQDLDLRKIAAITATTLGADYLWHKLTHRDKVEKKPTVRKPSGPRRTVVPFATGHELRSGGGSTAVSTEVKSAAIASARKESPRSATEMSFDARMKRLQELEHQLKASTNKEEVSAVIKALVELNKHVNAGKLEPGQRLKHLKYRQEHLALMDRAREKEKSFEPAANFEERASEKNKLFEEAQTLAELYKIIKRTGEIKGSHRYYSPAELVKVISRVRKGLLGTSHIPRTGGLRSKVEEIINLEKSKKQAA